jgi:pimeloyl-ACP methyl ester carboxylesterase
VVLALAAVALAAVARPPTLLLTPCDVQSVPAGCGTLRVPENRAKPNGRTIGLHVVVVPARHRPAAPDGAATEETYDVVTTFAPVHDRHDIVLVDQRGTGRSHPLDCPGAHSPADLRACATRAPDDMTQYGTRAAADDLDAVRAALAYDQLDVYGTSYGATLAQVYLRRHRGHVRTLILDGATLLDVPFYGQFAGNAQRALEQLARRCAASPGCAAAFPRWRQMFARLVRAWNADPVHRTRTATMTGDDLAGVVQDMLLSSDSAASIPLVVTRAAKGDYRPLNRQIEPGTFSRQLMFWSVWCNEPWVGLDATGPWHTDFDGYTTATITHYRATCRSLPRRSEPISAWNLPRTQVPLLALVGGADPQDPIGNLAGLRWFFPNGRAIVVPGYGHAVGRYGCLGGLVSLFVDNASAEGLDTRCVRAIRPPPFVLR